MLRLILTIMIIFTTSRVQAWSEAGHRIIGSIAFRQLTPTQQTKIVSILKQHPRFAEDFQAKMPDNLEEREQNEFIFQQAGIWPDMVRSFKGEDRKYHRPEWHYINLPHYLTEADQGAMEGKLKVNLSLNPPVAPQHKQNVIQTIKLARQMIADSSTPAADRAIMMCWLFHCLGDIHQPLHSTALFSQNLFPNGDRGGNSIKTAQKGNLHALWDQFLGNKAQYRTARNKAIPIVNDAEQIRLGKAAEIKLDEKVWMQESHTTAGATVYDSEVRGHLRAHADQNEVPELMLTERYLKEGGRVAEKRVIEAGYRLGAVLKELAAD